MNSSFLSTTSIVLYLSPTTRRWRGDGEDGERKRVGGYGEKEAMQLGGRWRSNGGQVNSYGKTRLKRGREGRYLEIRGIG